MIYREASPRGHDLHGKCSIKFRWIWTKPAYSHEHHEHCLKNREKEECWLEAGLRLIVYTKAHVTVVCQCNCMFLCSVCTLSVCVKCQNLCGECWNTQVVLVFECVFVCLFECALA